MSDSKEKGTVVLQMPSPPAHLIRKKKVVAAVNGQAPDPAVPHEEGDEPLAIEYIHYQEAIEDRRQAEIRFAELYEQYLEVAETNDRLLRRLQIFSRFKGRVRAVYGRALKGDENLLAALRSARRDVAAADRAFNGLQIENESLRLSFETHEQAFKQVAARSEQTDNLIASLQKQYQELSDEYENRGILLEESERSIHTYRAQMNQLVQSFQEHQAKLAATRDDNLILQNQIREVQLRETGIATLNHELTEVVGRAQRQIHDLEDKLNYEKASSSSRINALEQEIIRLKDNRRAEVLVEASRQVLSTRKEPTLPEEITLIDEVKEEKNQWNDLYNRWSPIINELSSHASPITNSGKKAKRPQASESETKAHSKTDTSTDQLVSEVGDLEIT